MDGSGGGLGAADTMQRFVAVSLMWMFYGTVLAILVVRLSLTQSEYLWKPRYVVTYAVTSWPCC